MKTQNEMPVVKKVFWSIVAVIIWIGVTIGLTKVDINAVVSCFIFLAASGLCCGVLCFFWSSVSGDFAIAGDDFPLR